MVSDIKQIGITKHNQEVMKAIMAKKWFKLEMDAARFAMAVAISSGVEPGSTDGAETVWNAAGGIDSDGELRGLITALFPGTETPYRLVQYFINVGLERIEACMRKSPDLDAVELIEIFSSSPQ